jgi:hypothetical protein
MSVENVRQTCTLQHGSCCSLYRRDYNSLGRISYTIEGDNHGYLLPSISYILLSVIVDDHMPIIHE